MTIRIETALADTKITTPCLVLDREQVVKNYPYLSPKFIFLYPAYNLRNNEISAVIGINQLKRLDKNNKKRNINFNYFIKNLDGTKFFKDFDLDGISNYAFPVILKSSDLKIRDRFEKKMKKYNIEFRRGNAGGGNQLRQPYLKEYVSKIKYSKFPIVEHVHNFGYYIGNYPELKKDKILKICKILNSIYE